MSDYLWKLEHVLLPGISEPRLQTESLIIPTGVTAVIGHSGAGKTSLLNLLVGFECPHRGTISSHPAEKDDRLPLFWVPQDDGLWPHLTVREHLQAVVPASNDSTELIDDLLTRFDLAELSKRNPPALSQGERARLSVARALAANARTLVMDEPLVHVDPARVGRYRQVVRQWCEKHETSLVLASHSPEVVLADARSVVCLERGRVLYQGAVDELYYRPASRELAEFLGPVNWFAPAEAGLWLNGQQNGTPCLRPEQLSVSKSAQGPLVVESVTFAGSIEEVELRHAQNGQRRRFHHRPARGLLQAGDRVALKVLMLFALIASLLGCQSEEGPVLPVSSFRYWQLPPEGPKVPRPRCMTVGPDDALYILDDAGRVVVYDRSGALERQWSMPDTEVGNPEAILILRDGRIAVADTHYSRVVFFDSTGQVLQMIGSHGTDPGEFIYPVALAEDDDENLYVCEYGSNDRVQKFSQAGQLLLKFGVHGTGQGEFQRPSGIVWHAGKIYVADAFNNRIQVFSDHGKFLAFLGSIEDGTSLHYPYDLCLDAGERLLVVEYGGGRVTVVDLTGKLLGRFGTTGSGADRFSTPWGLAVDSRKRIYVADTGNRRVVALEP